jgi:hypothetical protein
MPGADRQELRQATDSIAMGWMHNAELFGVQNFGPLPSHTNDETKGPRLNHSTAVYITPADTNPLLRKAFFPSPYITEAKGREAIGILRKQAVAKVMEFSPILTDGGAKQVASITKDSCEELAEEMSAESTSGSFQIIGVLAGYSAEIGPVIIAPETVLESIRKRLPDPLELHETSEQQYRDAYAYMSEQQTDLGPYEEWLKIKMEEAQRPPAEQKQELAKLIVGMLLMPRRQTHPVIQREVFEAVPA